MNLAHELAKIAAHNSVADLGRSLSSTEVATVAASITPLESIPRVRSFGRVCVPNMRKGTYGMVAAGRTRR